MMEWLRLIPPWALGWLIALVVLTTLINLLLLAWLIRLIRRTPTELSKTASLYSTLQSRFVDAGDSRIHYLQVGAGPHLVLLHGIGASVFVWLYVIEDLSKHFTITALDLPGFGKSSKQIQADYGLDAQHERLLIFLDKLEIGNAVLVGSSMGGAIALWTALKDPPRFPKVAGLSPATDSRIVPRRLTKLLRRVPYLHKTLNETTMNLILRAIFRRDELVAKESVRAYLEPYLDEGISARTFFAATELLADPRLPDAFLGFEHPVLLLYGARDRSVSRSSMERLHKLLPRSEFHVNKTAGHHLMEEEPSWCAELLIKFFT